MHRLFVTAVMVALSCVVACGDSAGPRDDAPLPEGFTDLCSGDAVPGLANVQTSPAHDYLALVHAQSFTGTNKTTTRATVEAGTPCATAKDEAKCLAALDALVPREGIGKSCGPGECTYSFYVFTRGDEVGALADEAALARFVAPIDNPYEAALVANGLADAMGCSADDRIGARSVGDAWEVTFTSGYSDDDDRCGGLARFYDTVRADGTKGDARRVITKPNDRPCGQP